MSTPADLAATLLRLDEYEYVRFVAHWMTEATEVDDAADLTGDAVIDALVAAAAARVGYQRTGAEPAWTYGDGRALMTRLWYPGVPSMFPYSLVRTPGAFIVRGIVARGSACVRVKGQTHYSVWQGFSLVWQSAPAEPTTRFAGLRALSKFGR